VPQRDSISLRLVRMKKLLQSPPTPVQQRARPKRSSSSTTTASPVKKVEQDVKFMEATFRVVGYQRLESGNEENVKSGDVSVFQANTRKSLGEGKLSLVTFIQSNYKVPSDFETSTKYGPHSGLCYEDRLITCYEWRKFSPKDSFKKKLESATEENEWKMCWKCQVVGDHLAREGCPKET
jgi:hypothetical protein